MGTKPEQYRRFLFLAIIIGALGFTINTGMKDSLGSLGTVLVAVSGLFYILGMSKKTEK